jgi:hypothetical protein
MALDRLVRLFYYASIRRTCVLARESVMGNLVLTIAVVLCAAYLLWQVFGADMVDDSRGR